MGIQIEQTKYTLLPTGEYPARIAAVEEDDKGLYGPQLKVKFELTGPADLAGNTLTGWCSATFSQKSKLYAWTRAALGGREIPATWTFDSDKLLGKLVTLVVVAKTKESGDEFNRVDAVKPARAATTAAKLAATLTAPVAVPPVPEIPDDWNETYAF